MAPAHEQKLRVALVPWMVAGIRTQYENLRVAEVPPDVQRDTLPVLPYKSGGLIEQLPLPSRVKGRLRSTTCALPLLYRRRYDAIWTQVWLPLLPFLMAGDLDPLSRPAIVYATDNAPTLLDGFSSDYGAAPLSSPMRHLRDSAYRYALGRCAMVLPWSRWAAQSLMRDYGVPDERIHVWPPGVDLTTWSLPAHRHGSTGSASSAPRRFQLLFVGADFARKGGLLLLDVFQSSLRETCDLHLVTKEKVDEAPGIYVYRSFEPNDPGLRRLYHTCDAFVLPTRADCFSLASVEAMACGLPVVACPVGGIPEIVEQGKTGFLVAPDDGRSLRDAVQMLVADPTRSRRMGLAGRHVVEQRFDSRRSAAALFDLLRHLSPQARGCTHDAWGDRRLSGEPTPTEWTGPYDR